MTQPSIPPRKMRANAKVVGTPCTSCGGRFQLAEEVWRCGECGGFHHSACFDSAVGCRHAPVALPANQVAIDGDARAAPVNGRTPHTVRDGDTTTCPVCAETIKKAALKCRFCGHTLDERVAQMAVDDGPKPPSIHWLLDLVLTVATCFLFAIGMTLWQSRWAKKVDVDSHATVFFALGLVVYFVGASMGNDPSTAPIGVFLVLASAVLLQAGNFSVKQAIEYRYHPVQLSGVATFFLGQLYFQYRFNELTKRPHTAEVTPMHAGRQFL